MRLRRGWALPVAIMSALGAGAPVSHGAVSFGTSVSPAAVGTGVPIDYGLTMVNGGDVEERFSVFVVPPVYGLSRPTATDGFGEGASIRPLGLPRIEGPGAIVGDRIAEVTVPRTRCSRAGAGDHGYRGRFRSLDVALPPRTTSTLRTSYVAGLPLWPDLDLRLRFELGPDLADGSRGTLAALKVVSPQPAIIGRVAVHMTLRTTPRSGTRQFSAAETARRGRRIAIAGRTNPAISGERVELRFARISRRGRVAERGRAARVRVDARGAFRAHWRPPRAGDYELWARYDSRLPHVASDDTCPRLLRVR